MQRIFFTTIVCLTSLILTSPSIAVKAKQESNYKSFTDWCNQKSKLPQKTRYTVEVLLSKAGTTDCVKANQYLRKLTKLSLIYNQISDIKPLSSLTNLTLLWLNSNKISDIKPLSIGLTQALPNLGVLGFLAVK